LEGEWKGECVTKTWNLKPLTFIRSIPMRIKFVLNKDSSYSVFCYSQLQNNYGPDADSVVTKLNYRILSKHTIYLEEVEILEPKDYPNECFQKMDLSIQVRKNSMELNGNWHSDKGDCFYTGTIHLKKKLTE
jgi:hypothetical protein